MKKPNAFSLADLKTSANQNGNVGVSVLSVYNMVMGHRNSSLFVTKTRVMLFGAARLGTSFPRPS